MNEDLKPRDWSTSLAASQAFELAELIALRYRARECHDDVSHYTADKIAERIREVAQAWLKR